ncbi:MAG: P1 family peptidase [Anaerovoracaceae bacterium]|jgi:L-aminopeptidase/D-esterase-like protein
MKEISITDISGIKVGHAQDIEGGTGCTVIICEKGAFAGVDVRGGGPASRETELLNPINMVEQIHAVMLSGGSAYGLDAGSGAMTYLEEQGVGFDVGVGVVPIVCGASLFDLVVGDPKSRPDKAMGYEACKNAGTGKVAEGNVGAGTGATVGKFLGVEHMMKSGLGTYALQIGDLKVAAIVAVNALGDVVDVDTGKRIAGILNEDKTALSNTEEIMYAQYSQDKNVFSGNTTIGCIVTNAQLTKSQANKLASIAHNGFARAIRPVHTMADGDTIFVMSTGEVEVMPDAVGALSTDVMARAINRAVRMAQPAYGLKAAINF